MALKTQQGIVIYSPAIIQGEKLQALIKQITPEYITIIIPINNITIEKGVDIFINFWDNQATYEFKSKSLSSKGPAENLLNIARPTTLTKVFNRSFPRVVIKTGGQIFDCQGLKSHQCLIYDISGGGVLLTSITNKKTGDMVKLSFSLPDGEIYEQVGGIIVWKKEKKEHLFTYGIEFDKLSEIRRQKIITFINSEIVKQKDK